MRKDQWSANTPVKWNLTEILGVVFLLHLLSLDCPQASSFLDSPHLFFWRMVWLELRIVLLISLRGMIVHGAAKSRKHPGISRTRLAEATTCMVKLYQYELSVFLFQSLLSLLQSLSFLPQSFPHSDLLDQPVFDFAKKLKRGRRDPQKKKARLTASACETSPRLREREP